MRKHLFLPIMAFCCIFSLNTWGKCPAPVKEIQFNADNYKLIYKDIEIGSSTIDFKGKKQNSPWFNFKEEANEPQVCLKPVIYLYPTKKESVIVQLIYDGNLIITYPPYNNKINGWSVTAYPDGRIIDVDSKEYSYIFWEGIPHTPIKYDFSKGFVVKGEDVVEFLQNTLSKMGLSPKEYNEFIVYWYPKMKQNKYNLVHFAGAEYDNVAKLKITPHPDSILRVFMAFKAINEMINIEPQEIKSFHRSGFAVVEWGGTEIDG